jgi:hypothetical protein
MIWPLVAQLGFLKGKPRSETLGKGACGCAELETIEMP